MEFRFAFRQNGNFNEWGRYDAYFADELRRTLALPDYAILTKKIGGMMNARGLGSSVSLREEVEKLDNANANRTPMV
jgi:hypothetical protein